MSKIIRSWDDCPVVMSVNDVSILLDISKRTVRRLCAQGDIPANKIGKDWRIEKEALKGKFPHTLSRE
jgi:excisionase family DNA binding protein